MIDGEAWRVFALLATMGLLYDALVSYVQEQLPDRHGITAWLVVGGVLWTLFGVLMLEGISVFMRVLLCFASSGTPMVIGSMRRYQHERKDA